MSDLSAHFQYLPGWSKKFVVQSGVSLIKIVNPPEQNPFPGIRIIGRPFMEDHESNDLIRRGADGASAWYAQWKPWIKARPYLYATEGPNEPQPMAAPQFRKNLNDFTVRLSSIFTAEQLRLVGLNFSVGWPHIGDAPDFAAAVTALHNGGHIVGLHEYSARAMWDVKGYHCLRYRSTVREWRNAGIPIPDIFIGECGIDGGVRGEHKQGWRMYATEDEYLEQLAWYDEKLMEDPYIMGAVVFTVCNWDWYSFDLGESMAMKLATHIAGHPSPEPTPPTPPPPPPPEPEPTPPGPQFVRPLKKQWTISSSFKDHENRNPPSNAPGCDYATPRGTPVYAVASGRVSGAMWRDGGGRSMFVTHAEGWKSYYAHLSSFSATGGEQVYQNQLLGFTGNTAKKYVGPHLHLGIMNPAGKWMDPETLLPG